MHIVRHLRKLADRNSYSRVINTKWIKTWAEVEFTNPETGEIYTEWAVESQHPAKRKRKVRRRVKRWRRVNGFEVVNDALGYVADIGRIMAERLPELSDREGYDLRLLGRPDEPDWFDSDSPQWGHVAGAA